jgi:hypothetical protein
VTARATLDPWTPLADLCEAAGVTRATLADRLAVRPQSLRDGPNIQFSTLLRAARALGVREIRVSVPAEEGVDGG